MINIYDIFGRMKIRGTLIALFLIFFSFFCGAQSPASLNSSELLLRIRKLKVLGSVLYIAAHPDDENPRLLAWLSKDQLFRTGYLSITRGDGGQNLIGNEQGIELGLIRTQELLAARRIDGAEQFFTRGFDFGYSKSTDEALRFWGREQVLGDVIRVIRKLRPDVIITRFPPDNRAGHGHHSASAFLAREAFRLAADPKAYPEQIKEGLKPWQAKRLLWNNYNFGSVNTIKEDQLKIDVGGYSPLLGKSYGELAAESRSQHKSQGFGVPAGRGEQSEYFSFTDGSEPHKKLTDSINTGWSRTGAAGITMMIDKIIRDYNASLPSASVPALVSLYKSIKTLPNSEWKEFKLNETREIIAAAAGLWMEGFTTVPTSAQGDSITMHLSFINRAGASVQLLSYNINDKDSTINSKAPINQNLDYLVKLKVPGDFPLSQPYWLREKMTKGSYTVSDQKLIGLPQADAPYYVTFVTAIQNEVFTFTRPVMYKYTDPVKGEQYEPLAIIPSTKNLPGSGTLRHIAYEHIPDVYYFNKDTVQIVLQNVKTDGKKIGYIDGAGDKVPAALVRMGYEVTMLKENDISENFLKQFDAVITGVRAYNVHAYLTEKNKILNDYIRNGGNLVVQYNTNSFAGPNNATIGPLPLHLSRERITDETAPVKFLLPQHQVLNYPNKISPADFDNWIQERAIYLADQLDTSFVTPLSMHDPEEAEHNGSLVIADYGKGKFVYTGLVFFRELPAGVSGAYRLLANIIALNKLPK